MAIKPAPFVPPTAAPDPRKRLLVFGLLGLAFFLAWQALVLKSFLREDSRPPRREEAVVLNAADDARAGVSPAPSLYLKVLASATAGGDAVEAARWVNWFYLALLGGALFGLAFHFRPDWSALPCALIFLCAPGAQELLYSVSPDLALTAWTAVSYWALVRSEDFKNWAWSLAFGILFALGMLHQARYWIYMLPAFYLGIKALGQSGSWKQVLACLWLVSVLFGSWLWIHADALLSGLLRTTDRFPGFSLSHGAFFHHFLGMAASLGPPFWLLAILGILVPQFHRAGARGWLMTSWFGASYLLLSLVPGQSARLLMPAMPALAVAGMGAWPVPLIWALAAFQVLGAANYPQGWMTRQNLPVPGVAFFPNDPAAAEDWKLADIVQEAQQRHQLGRHPLAIITVAANHPRFNISNLDWTARRLGLSDVRLKGAVGRCGEFSEFVLAKTGQSLPQDLEQSWFPKAYEEAARWPLPDGSEAILYQQRRLTAPPAPQRLYEFQHYEASGIVASGLRLELGPFDRNQGVYRRAVLSASKAKLAGLGAGAVKLELSDLAFVPLAGMDDLRFLRLGELRVVQADISSESLRRYLESRVAGLKVEKLALGKEARARGRIRGLAFWAQGAISRAPEAVRARIVKARLGPIDLPSGILRGLEPFMIPLTPTVERPFSTRLTGLTMNEGGVSVP